MEAAKRQAITDCVRRLADRASDLAHQAGNHITAWDTQAEEGGLHAAKEAIARARGHLVAAWVLLEDWADDEPKPCEMWLESIDIVLQSADEGVTSRSQYAFGWAATNTEVQPCFEPSTR